MEWQHKWQGRVQEHYDEACSLGHNIFGVFLQGSQNYGLEHEGSDVDTKALVLPSFGDICRNRKLVSTTHVRANNEHIDLKDIRLMFQNWLKQNINMVEILFTPYYVVAPQYLDLWEELMAKREQIARYDMGRGINCCAGMAYEKHKAMKHPYPSLIDKVEKYGYDPKQLHHIIRMQYHIKYFFRHGLSFEETLDITRKNHGTFLRYIKTEPSALEAAEKMAEWSLNCIEIDRKWFAIEPVVVDTSIPEFLDSMIEKIMRRSFNMKEEE